MLWWQGLVYFSMVLYSIIIILVVVELCNPTIEILSLMLGLLFILILLRGVGNDNKDYKRNK